MSDQLRPLIFDQRHRIAHLERLASKIEDLPEFVDQRRKLTDDIAAAQQALVAGLSAVDQRDFEDGYSLLKDAEGKCWRAERRLIAMARYSDADRLVTRLTHQMCAEIKWPIAAPLVLCTADSGYTTWSDADVIFVGPADHCRVLAWPDISHEMGHALCVAGILYFGDFLSNVTRPRFAELGEAPPPPDLIADLDDDANLDWDEAVRWASDAWADWAEELACDAFATFVTGASYAEQHTRISLLEDRSIYDPIMPDISTHPPNLARARTIASVLRRIGDPSVAQRLLTTFDLIANLDDEPWPEDLVAFDIAFADDLIEQLVDLVEQACRGCEIVTFDATPAESMVRSLVQAWERFKDKPADFFAYEQALVEGFAQAIT